MSMMSACFSLFVALLLLMTCPFHQSNGMKLGQLDAKRCSIFKGSWILDNSWPLYDASKCPFIDAGLNCQKNGRPDKDYLKYRWKPNGCELSRFNGEDFLQRFRGKKIMFVGDSLSSNQWQSLACMIHAAVPNSNYTLVRKKLLYALTFPDYGVSIMYLKNGFLVDTAVKKVGRVVKLDSISKSKLWQGNVVLIFNSYHWWLHTGRDKTWDYFEVGKKLYKQMNRMRAYKIALTTWAKWVDSNINITKTKLFFQGISATHYDGREWNESTGHDCSGQTKPVEGSSYPGHRDRGEAILKSVLSTMTVPVNLLDITLLTQLRKDGHPSIYADVALDCSHWCLAGVPDAWNQLLYTILLQP